MLDANALKSALSEPAIAAMSDAEAAAKLSEPIVTLRSEPIAQKVGDLFVAAKILAPDDVAKVFSTTTYAAGVPVGEKDVAAARAEIAAAQQVEADERRIVLAFNAALNLRQSGETDWAAIQKAFDVALAGGG